MEIIQNCVAIAIVITRRVVLRAVSSLRTGIKVVTNVSGTVILHFVSMRRFCLNDLHTLPAELPLLPVMEPNVPRADPNVPA